MENKEPKIYLISHRVDPLQDVPDVVRVTPEAGAIIRALQRETGLPVRSIVSQIIIQAESFIECRVEE